MKILVTGANGFLGTYLRKYLSHNNEVYSLSRSRSDFNVKLDNEIPNFTQQFDLVIHSAGKAHFIPKNEIESLEYYKSNVLGTINLLDAFYKSFLPKYFVFISSVSVYGLVSGQNIDENTPLLANDPYGKSKIEAELIVQDWCNRNNIICTILRLPLVFGKNPPGNLGEMIKGINNGYYFNIAGGNTKKSMVLATDVSKYILRAAGKGGIYNLSDGYHPTFYELSTCIANQLGKSSVSNLPKFFAIILAKVGDIFGNKFPINSIKLSKITSTLTFDDTKARTNFGWNPTSVLDSFKMFKYV